MRDLTGETVDKASVVIVKTADGSLRYFASERSLCQFRGERYGTRSALRVSANDCPAESAVPFSIKLSVPGVVSSIGSG